MQDLAKKTAETNFYIFFGCFGCLLKFAMSGNKKAFYKVTTLLSTKGQKKV